MRRSGIWGSKSVGRRSRLPQGVAPNRRCGSRVRMQDAQFFELYEGDRGANYNPNMCVGIT